MVAVLLLVPRDSSSRSDTLSFFQPTKLDRRWRAQVREQNFCPGRPTPSTLQGRYDHGVVSSLASFSRRFDALATLVSIRPPRARSLHRRFHRISNVCVPVSIPRRPCALRQRRTLVWQFGWHAPPVTPTRLRLRFRRAACEHRALLLWALGILDVHMLLTTLTRCRFPCGGIAVYKDAEKNVATYLHVCLLSPLVCCACAST